MNNVITCNVCGQEYSPAEIFIPNEFFGNPKEIIRDPSTGKIEFVTGTDMNLDEEFTCYNCGNKMKIHARLSFLVNDEHFDEEFSTPINKPKKLTLSEGFF